MCAPRLLALLFLIPAPALWLLGYPGRAPTGNAGAPGDVDPPCSRCHRVTLNPAGGKVEVVIPEGLIWRQGQKQSWTVRITEPDISRHYGFELTTSPSGTLTAGLRTAASAGYIYHTGSQSSYSFEWAPPDNATGGIQVYVAALTGRGTSNSKVYTAKYTLSPATSVADPPRLNAANPAVNGASFLSSIASGSWVTLYGESLSPAGVSRIWGEADIVNGKLPLALDGVSVKINNRDAAVYYIGPTQLNVLAPEDTATGAVSVQVTTPAGTSGPATATLVSYAPAFFCFDPQSRKHPAALSATYATIGPENLFGASVTTRPAKPGETVLLFGTGFGPTNPAVSADSAFQGAAPLSDPSALRVTIGGVAAHVSFAGLSGPGLYQFNVEVPDLSDGDHALLAEIGGARSQFGVYLTVKR